MGCSSSSKASQPDTASTEELRRRLSVGEVDAGEGCGKSLEASEEESTFVNQLMTQSILEFLPKSERCQDMPLGKTGKRFSLGTVQMESALIQNSFQSKHVNLEGDQRYQFDSSKEHVGFACKKGLKPEAPNQDSFCILKFGACALYGVFDGHGRNGHDVSNFVKDNMPKVLLSQPKFETDPGKALLLAFEKVQSLIVTATAMKHIDATRSGTTCTLVLHSLERNTVYIAHVGDSRVVLGRKPKESTLLEAVDLTVDHKPDLPAERERIEQAGGVVIFDGGWNYRVFAKDKKDSRGKRYPGLNMSRAMGDLNGFNDAGISAVPEVLIHKVDIVQELDVPGITEAESPTLREAAKETSAPSVDTGATPSVSSHNINPVSDKFLIAASDGVWEFISSDEAIQEVSQFPPNQAGTAAEHLAALAWDRWMLQMEGQVVDDITCLVIYL